MWVACGLDSNAGMRLWDTGALEPNMLGMLTVILGEGCCTPSPSVAN